jgi:hypothetical protein
MEAPQPQQLNYRQIGKRVDVGSLCRGFVSSPATGSSSKTAASIPSRFETIINSSQRESRAFGSQSTRFRSNEVPFSLVFPSLLPLTINPALFASVLVSELDRSLPLCVLLRLAPRRRAKTLDQVHMLRYRQW